MINRNNKYGLKLVLSSLLILFLLVLSSSIRAQNRPARPKDPRTSTLLAEGKTFKITYYSFDTLKHSQAVPSSDEILFLNRKFFTLNVNKENNLVPDVYYASIDSSDGIVRIKFVAFSKDASGNPDIFWQGNISGNSIQGTMHWFRYNTTWMFSGVDKNSGKEK